MQPIFHWQQQSTLPQVTQPHQVQWCVYLDEWTVDFLGMLSILPCWKNCSIRSCAKFNIAGQTMLVSFFISSGDWKTFLPSIFRSMERSVGLITSFPNVSITFLYASVSTLYASWPNLSQSTTAAPSFSMRRAMLDFPEPMPPVSPIMYGRFGWLAFYNR